MGCATSWQDPDAGKGAQFFPQGEIELREGDILLVFNQTLLSLAFTHYGIPPGPYSHSGLYCRDEQGRGRVMFMDSRGLSSRSVEEFFRPASRMALVRLSDCTEERTSALGRTARDVWRHNNTRALRFDHKFIKNGADDGEFFCNELLSHIYRAGGLPDPFVQLPGVGETPWTRWMRDYACIDLVQSVSPNAVLEAEQFTTLAEVTRVEKADLQQVIESAVLLRVRQYVTEQGYEPLRPSLGSRMMIALEKAFILRSYMRELPTPRLREFWYIMAECSAAVCGRTRRILARRGIKDWSEDEVRELVNQVCDAFRHKYFRKVGNPGGSGSP